MAKTISATSIHKKPKVKRPGIHAKTKSSRSKNAKNYVKLSRGQG